MNTLQLLTQSDLLLKEIADRLKSPSKMFGIIGPKVSASDTEKLQACIKNLKMPLHGAIHYRNLLHAAKKEPTDAVLDELDTFIGEKGIVFGSAPYAGLINNYFFNVIMVIDRLTKPEKNTECISFTRIKNLIENSMKSKNIDLTSLKTSLLQEVSTAPKLDPDKHLLTANRAINEQVTVMKTLKKGQPTPDPIVTNLQNRLTQLKVDDVVQRRDAARNGGKTRKYKLKQKRTRKHKNHKNSIVRIR